MKDSIRCFLVKTLLASNRPYATIKCWIWLFRFGLANPLINIDKEEFIKLYGSKYSEFVFEGPIGMMVLRIARVYGLTKKDMIEVFHEGFNDGLHGRLNK